MVKKLAKRDRRPSERLRLGGAVSQYESVAKYQQIHFGAQKAVERLLGLADDRLILVERRIQYHGHAR